MPESKGAKKIGGKVEEGPSTAWHLILLALEVPVIGQEAVAPKGHLGTPMLFPTLDARAGQ